MLTEPPVSLKKIDFLSIYFTETRVIIPHIENLSNLDHLAVRHCSNHWYVFYHRLRSSVSTVVTMTSKVNGKTEI